MRVTLCEAKRFPRVKVCGEFLSPAAIKPLESLVGVTSLLDAGARVVSDVVIEQGDREARWKLHQPGLSLSRALLDTALLDAARLTGVNVLQPARIMRVQFADDHIEAQLGNSACVRATFVVHADGSGALDPRGAIRRRTDVLGLKRHFSRSAARGIDGVRMRACAGVYVGLTQVEGDAATCAMLARKAVVAKHDGDATAILRAVLPPRVFASLELERDAPKPLDTAWRACGGPGSALVTGGHPRSFRIGDAAAGVDPIAGEGVTIALLSSKALAAAIEPAALQHSQRALSRVQKRALLLRRFGARIAGELFLRERLTSALWPAALAPAASIGLWCAATGKGAPGKRTRFNPALTAAT